MYPPSLLIQLPDQQPTTVDYTTLPTNTHYAKTYTTYAGVWLYMRVIVRHRVNNGVYSGVKDGFLTLDSNHKASHFTQGNAAHNRESAERRHERHWWLALQTIAGPFW